MFARGRLWGIMMVRRITWYCRWVDVLWISAPVICTKLILRRIWTITVRRPGNC